MDNTSWRSSLRGSSLFFLGNSEKASENTIRTHLSFQHPQNTRKKNDTKTTFLYIQIYLFFI